MKTEQRYFDDLNALLLEMPPGTIDMGAIEANERRHRHTFFDPPETVQQWLLDQQRRVQVRHPVPLREGRTRPAGMGEEAPDRDQVQARERAMWRPSDGSL